MIYQLENILTKKRLGARSRFVVVFYKLLGMAIGKKNRFEYGRARRITQISIGNSNAFSSGYQLWPEDVPYDGIRIQIGNTNYFNRNLMVDACGYVKIGNNNLFGPDVYITDSNHSFGPDIVPKSSPMIRGTVSIGNDCWIGAKVTILKGVVLGDGCVVGAGSVVTKSFEPGSVIGGIPAKILKSVEKKH